jgi:hypothetical protein
MHIGSGRAVRVFSGLAQPNRATRADLPIINA